MGVVASLKLEKFHLHIVILFQERDFIPRTS